MAMLWDFGSAVSSQQQAAGDHVQRAASREPQQQKHPQHPQQRQQAGQELVPWIPTNPDGVMNRLVDKHYAMDPMRRSFDRYDGALKSTTGSSDREKTYETPDGNVFNIDDERFRCAEVLSQPSSSEKKSEESMTNLYRAPWLSMRRRTIPVGRAAVEMARRPQKQSVCRVFLRRTVNTSHWPDAEFLVQQR